MLWHNKAIFGINGKLKGILSVGSDITERKRREEMLVESYKHLGLVNRKLSFLSELDQLGYMHEGKKKTIAERILGPLTVFSSATFGVILTCEGEIFKLISSIGLEKNDMQAMKKIPNSSCNMMKYLFEKKTRIQGFSKDYDLGKLNPGKRAKYFILIPISLRNDLKAFIFLGFQDKKDFAIPELEFLDIFSTHVAIALSNAGIIK